MHNREVACTSCGRTPLSKDEIGASKKLLGVDTKECYCIDCLAAYLEVSQDDIKDKIEMFKENGCKLFE